MHRLDREKDVWGTQIWRGKTRRANGSGSQRSLGPIEKREGQKKDRLHHTTRLRTWPFTDWQNNAHSLTVQRRQNAHYVKVIKICCCQSYTVV